MGIFQQKKALEGLAEGLSQLQSLVEAIERDVRGLRLEYIELYDKVSHQMSRMAKRAAVNAKDETEPEAAAKGNSHSDSLDPISERIHRRRNRVMLGQ